MSEPTPPTLIPCPEPGIHKDIPSAEYHLWDAPSKSALDWIYDYSPMHLKYFRENPPEPTPALRIGSALHCAVLEPEKFESEYIVATGCCAIVSSTNRPCGNAGKVFSGGSWYCGVHAKGRENRADASKTLTTPEKEQIDNMARAVSFHPAAAWAVKQEGENELSAVWDQKIKRMGEDDALRCKMRCDGLRKAAKLILDIKTCECAKEEDFTKSIDEYGYHRQAAFYQDGLRALGIDIEHFVFIAVEKNAPYGVAVYRIKGIGIELGRVENDRLLEVYANCEAANHWPGYSNEIQDISVSHWKMRRELNKDI